jgi:hypothetical protein
MGGLYERAHIIRYFPPARAEGGGEAFFGVHRLDCADPAVTGYASNLEVATHSSPLVFGFILHQWPPFILRHWSPFFTIHSSP